MLPLTGAGWTNVSHQSTVDLVPAAASLAHAHERQQRDEHGYKCRQRSDEVADDRCHAIHFLARTLRGNDGRSLVAQAFAPYEIERQRGRHIGAIL